MTNESVVDGEAVIAVTTGAVEVQRDCLRLRQCAELIGEVLGRDAEHANLVEDVDRERVSGGIAKREPGRRSHDPPAVSIRRFRGHARIPVGHEIGETSREAFFGGECGGVRDDFGLNLELIFPVFAGLAKEVGVGECTNLERGNLTVELAAAVNGEIGAGDGDIVPPLIITLRRRQHTAGDVGADDPEIMRLDGGDEIQQLDGDPALQEGHVESHLGTTGAEHGKDGGGRQSESERNLGEQGLVKLAFIRAGIISLDDAVVLAFIERGDAGAIGDSLNIDQVRF